MPVTLRQYRGAVGGFNSQFVPNKQYKFFYSNSFRKLNVPAVSIVSLIIIYVFMKLLVPNDLHYMFLSIKNIKNIRSLVSRGLYFDISNICTSYLGLFNSDYSEW